MWNCSKGKLTVHEFWNWPKQSSENFTKRTLVWFATCWKRFQLVGLRDFPTGWKCFWQVSERPRSVELEPNGAVNRCIQVCYASLGWHSADNVELSATSGPPPVSVACDVRDSTDCWGSATGQLWTLHSPSHSDRRGYTRTSVSCTQPKRHTLVTIVSPILLKYSRSVCFLVNICVRAEIFSKVICYEVLS